MFRTSYPKRRIIKIDRSLRRRIKMNNYCNTRVFQTYHHSHCNHSNVQLSANIQINLIDQNEKLAQLKMHMTPTILPNQVFRSLVEVTKSHTDM